MSVKEAQLLRLLELKFQAAEARVKSARDACEDINNQMTQLIARRNTMPADPSDQIYHERHLGWLDRRGRELSILAAQAAAEYGAARESLSVEFGRKSAFKKAIERREAEEHLRISRQLS